MKITICGSIAFYSQMQELKTALEKSGHEVDIPPMEILDENGNKITVQKYYEIRKAEKSENSWIWKRKTEAMKDHFSKIKWADAVLVTNYAKNGVDGYIGANTLLEMGLALHLDKKIFLLNPIPEISYKEEILGMQPIIINSNLELIN